MLDEVETFAGALKELGIKKGDVVLFYMPNIPAALIGFLAVNRLGAIHSAVFGGFAPRALADRIEGCKPIAILTASCGIEGTKPAIRYKPLVEEAVQMSTHKPDMTIVWQRNQAPWEPLVIERNQICWQHIAGSARERGIKAACVPVKSSDPIYILYTSGTTGSPKGVQRDAGGHAVGLHFSASNLFNIKGAGDVIFAASDIGWALGHSYMLYCPLLVGAATVVYEGKPVGTPDASAFWRIVEEYRVNILYTAPTSLRVIRRDDPSGLLQSNIGQRGGLRSLRSIFLAGEHAEPALVVSFQRMLDEFGAPASRVFDTWWTTEVGSPITGVAFNSHKSAAEGNQLIHGNCESPAPLGSAGKSLPGYDVCIVDDDGCEKEAGVLGNIVLRLPLAPTALCTLWNDKERFYNAYLRRFNGLWMDTGDFGLKDANGYIYVMGRNDDLLNVSGHRLSNGAIEQAIANHPLISESCVVGIPDLIKGELPFAFVTFSSAVSASSPKVNGQMYTEIQSLVRQHVGPIATLAGVVQGAGIIPKTRSGKILHQVLRELLTNAINCENHKEVTVPTTIEDINAVDAARKCLTEYFQGGVAKADTSKDDFGA
ncbi:hypothetical protein QQS21_005860 [Conoideocrella luteorostrata]|uniref:Uncharacterized protein n=1 Tax=Conoideocrella luteorostrata TaxID=1105319 RepID=A0AAJ0CNV5_9HYPO|nr:hypothetical protein QQS21_005860 [Conoideocrella luteorostrata]